MKTLLELWNDNKPKGRAFNVYDGLLYGYRVFAVSASRKRILARNLSTNELTFFNPECVMQRLR